MLDTKVTFEIGLLVPEKIFKVFNIYGHDSHLCHVTWTISTNFGSPFIRLLHIRLIGIYWPSGLREGV